MHLPMVMFVITDLFVPQWKGIHAGIRFEYKSGCWLYNSNYFSEFRVRYIAYTYITRSYPLRFFLPNGNCHACEELRPQRVYHCVWCIYCRWSLGLLTFEFCLPYCTQYIKLMTLQSYSFPVISSVPTVSVLCALFYAWTSFSRKVKFHCKRMSHRCKVQWKTGIGNVSQRTKQSIDGDRGRYDCLLN